MNVLASLESQPLGSYWWWGPVHSIPTLARPVLPSDWLVEERITQQIYLGLGFHSGLSLQSVGHPPPQPLCLVPEPPRRFSLI